MILSLINLLLILILTGFTFYVFLKQRGFAKTTQKRMDELKARMGTLVKELNHVLAKKREIDNTQIDRIDNLRADISEEFDL